MTWIRQHLNTPSDALVVILLAIFIVQWLLTYVGIDLTQAMALTSAPKVPQDYAKLLSYGWFHAHFVHVFWNVLLLEFIGRTWSSVVHNQKSFGILFCAGLLSGGLLFWISSFWKTDDFALIGSSAGVLAVFAHLVKRQPSHRVKFLFGFLPLWVLLAAVFLMEGVYAVADHRNAWPHLAGLICGTFWPSTPLFSSKPRPRSVLHGLRDPNARLNAVLDKVKSTGLDSLEPDERAFLDKLGA